MRAERTWPGTAMQVAAGCAKGVDGWLKLEAQRARTPAHIHTDKLQGQKSHRTLENRTRLLHSGTTQMCPLHTSVLDRTVYADIR